MAPLPLEPAHETVYKPVPDVCCSPAFQITRPSQLCQIALSHAVFSLELHVLVHAFWNLL